MPTLPGFELYGGATISRIYDGSGAEYIACCARKQQNGAFGFYIFRNGVEVPYVPFCTGRGSISPGGGWIATNEGQYHTGWIPGFVPHPKGERGEVGPPGPKGDPGPPASLSERYRAALERLCSFLGI